MLDLQSGEASSPTLILLNILTQLYSILILPEQDFILFSVAISSCEGYPEIFGDLWYIQSVRQSLSLRPTTPPKVTDRNIQVF